jgi:hypothetical protein
MVNPGLSVTAMLQNNLNTLRGRLASLRVPHLGYALGLNFSAAPPKKIKAPLNPYLFSISPRRNLEVVEIFHKVIKAVGFWVSLAQIKFRRAPIILVLLPEFVAAG